MNELTTEQEAKSLPESFVTQKNYLLLEKV